MTGDEALRLIRLPIPTPTQPQIWADLGSGHGLFAHALLQQLPTRSQVYAIDRDTTPAPVAGIIPRQIDFLTQPWDLPLLDGILMANALHFVEDQSAFLHRAASQLQSGGRFLFVEYDTDTPNPWVPYPLSFHSLQALFRKLNLSPPQLIHSMPSRFGGARLYSAWARL